MSSLVLGCSTTWLVVVARGVEVAVRVVPVVAFALRQPAPRLAVEPRGVGVLVRLEVGGLLQRGDQCHEAAV